MKLFDNTLGRLERSLDVRQSKHVMLSGNLANVDTPQYNPRDLDFDAAMRETSRSGMAVTDQGHIQDGDSSLEFDDMNAVDGDMASASIDGNTVDLDRTMAKLAENATQYGAAAKTANKKLAILRYVASDGGA